MNVKAKTYEIGILRAHGVGGGRVLAVFGVQGVLIGLAAFAAAAGAVWLLEPSLRGLVAAAFGLKSGAVLTGSPFEAALLWLPGAVLGIAVGFSLLGVLVPASFACRLSPVEALRRRE
jgi:putative ABC transport system permease protein